MQKKLIILCFLFIINCEDSKDDAPVTVEKGVILETLTEGLANPWGLAFLTDGRFSGGTHGFVVGHISPEAHIGGPLALVEEGDNILIDTNKKVHKLEVESKVLVERKKAWNRPKKEVEGGLAKYSKMVSSASKGAVTS